MKNKRNRTITIPWTKLLRVRLTVSVIIAALLVGVVMVFFLNHIYQRRIDVEYGNKVTALSNIVASMIDSETIDRYHETHEKDEEYERILEQLRIWQREFGIAYIVISRIDAEGETYLFDTDTDEEWHMELGRHDLYLDENDPMPDDFMNNILPMILSGEKMEPWVNELWGGLLKTITHIRRADGSIAASVSVSVFMDDIMRERSEMFALLGLLIAAIVIIAIVFSLLFINKYADTKNKAEELARKTEFYHRMAHDIITPLSRISTNIQVADIKNETDHKRLTDSQNDIMMIKDMITNALSDSWKDGEKS